MKLPEIRIQYSWLLAMDASLAMEQRKMGQVDDTDHTEQDEQKVQAYRAVWAKHESKILTAMCECLGLEFKQSIIDVWIAPWFIPQSAPLIINLRHDSDAFVDVLMHELIHVLLTDNMVYSDRNTSGDHTLGNHWKKLFPELTDDFVALMHGPVHAVSQYIYLDVQHEPARLERDKADLQHLPSYVKAWEYVESHGYHRIIDALRKNYEEMAGMAA